MVLMTIGAIYLLSMAFVICAIVGFCLWFTVKVVQATWKFALLGAVSIGLIFVTAAITIL